MTILEALVKLRDDLKIWVINNLRTKVDKQDGKQLSTNDYTEEEKNKLAQIAKVAVSSTQPSGQSIGDFWYKIV